MRKPFKSVSLVSVLSLALLSGAVKADVCDVVAARIQANAPKEFANGLDDWNGYAMAREVAQDTRSFFSQKAQAALLAEAASAGGDEEHQAMWADALVTAQDERGFLHQRFVELKDAGIGYLETENGGTAHCVNMSFYSYGADRQPNLVKTADGKVFSDGTCYNDTGNLVEINGKAVWIMLLPGDAVPSNWINVWEWRAPYMVKACTITADYAYEYRPGAEIWSAGEVTTTEAKFVIDHYRPWLETYRRYYDARYEKTDNREQRRTRLQNSLLETFYAQYPASVGDVMAIRSGQAGVGSDGVDFPVMYEDHPAVVHVEQGWLSTTRREVGLTLWTRDGTKIVKRADFFALPVATALNLQIDRSGKPSDH